MTCMVLSKNDYWIRWFILLVIETVVGIIANGFIVLMNYMDWFKSRKLTPPDLILTCLGLSRLAWYFAILVNSPNVIPLLIFLSSPILLITSLWKHTRNLQRNGNGIKDLNTQVHVTAIKALASFSVLYLSSFLAFIAQAILVLNNMDHPWSMMLIAFIPSAE
uniref:taste receptor type 2 member 140-like n=1 Tax=Euleptes europaea TaxID=460621 RepID=UPI00253FE7D3|nr:taste receptor type 2 member 140-like [Euleptes europaea]